MSKTKIEWADLTINPIIGCSKCSPGCDNCYAERFAARLAKNPATAERYSRVITDGKWNGRTDVAFLHCFRGLPAKPKRIFIGSMGDVFHRDVTEEDIQWLFGYMQVSLKHTFMLLTKRPERMRYLITLENGLREKDDDEDTENRLFREWPLSNVWLGVTVCNQQEADEKIPILLSTPAAKRFVSVEPMLGPISLKDWLYGENRLAWVICGGETGLCARPMHPNWVRLLRDQCTMAGVPFFLSSGANGGRYTEPASPRRMTCLRIRIRSRRGHMFGCRLVEKPLSPAANPMRSCFAWARARRDVSLTRANGRNFPESVDDRI